MTEPVWLACRADDAAFDGQAAAKLGDFADHPWVAPTAEFTCFEMLERACGLAGFKPRVVAESMDYSVQLELVAAGAGVALVPALTVQTVPQDVVLRHLVDPLERSLFVAARTATFADPGAQEIMRRLATIALSVGMRAGPT
ncbi:MAG: LysR substrate-binding domain-containing protein [Candidatus Limnocylindrales bacterium]